MWCLYYEREEVGQRWKRVLDDQVQAREHVAFQWPMDEISFFFRRSICTLSVGTILARRPAGAARHECDEKDHHQAIVHPPSLPCQAPKHSRLFDR